MRLPEMLDLPTVRALYAGGEWTPAQLIAAVAERIAAADPALFISRATDSALLVQVAQLLARAPAPNSLPLWGLPCAIKDNIDVEGFATTCACPAFARPAKRDAEAVARLRAAGAIIMGKTNLDQFATGLNGTRSPYGVPRNAFNADYISGGSSSGSAVAVATGLASFALGTDTAGSGRVPAGFNNIVGIKPTPGLVSNAGMVPACRSLDCVSIFAATVEDGAEVRRLIEGFDPADPFSCRAEPRSLPAEGVTVGVLAAGDREFFGDGDCERLYREAIERAVAIGCRIVEIDYAPFAKTAALLYEGPWVAERLAAFESFGVPFEAVEPTVATITAQGRGKSAADAFRGQYRLAELRRQVEAEWEKADVLLLPSAPTIYRVSEMLAQPIMLNSHLGTYTNFFNLLGLCGIAVPAGFRADGLPFGVTLAAPGFADEALLGLASAMHHAAGCGMGRAIDAAVPPPGPSSTAGLRLAVVGAHLGGMALNHELRALGATFVAEVRTAADYRLFLLDTTPPKPGLVREPGHAGPGIAIEIWSLPPAAFGHFVEHIPAPLGIGKILLEDGATVSGFLCEAGAVVAAQEISGFGGWRAFMAAQMEGAQA